MRGIRAGEPAAPRSVPRTGLVAAQKTRQDLLEPVLRIDIQREIASSALDARVPVTLVQKWLGHSRRATMAIYANAVGAEERRIAYRYWTTF